MADWRTRWAVSRGPGARVSCRAGRWAQTTLLTLGPRQPPWPPPRGGGRSRAGAEGLAGPPPPPCRVAQGSLVDTLREVRPTTFYGVPWIWERLLDNLKTSQLACTAFRRAVDKWAMGLGLETNRRRMLR